MNPNPEDGPMAVSFAVEDEMNREQRRAADRDARAAQRRRREPSPTEQVAIQLAQMNRLLSAVINLQEVQVRLSLGHSEEEVAHVTGITFPRPTEEELQAAREARAEAERQAAEDRRLAEEAAEDAAEEERV